VSALLLTAGLFHAMIVEHPEAFTHVRHVMTGGDVISPAHVARLFEIRPDVLFTNGYGPTKNTSHTTYWTSRGPAEGQRVPIGAAITGTRVLVLDRSLQPVPPGVCGEVYTGGLGLAHGYVGQPSRTAERFVANPFHPGQRLYRTGDLAFWRVDGVLEFIGRSDREIKIRGFGVDPAEVEEELRRLPPVRDPIVVAEDSLNGQHQLVAHVLPHRPGEVRGPELRAALAERIADLVPAIVLQTTLPLTANGKVDRAALPGSARSARALAPPLSPRERSWSSGSPPCGATCSRSGP
jgi:acyl-coenzyme A synthetase/AMP-(fatty) acid ligase